jgi:hypothetical protein
MPRLPYALFTEARYPNLSYYIYMRLQSFLLHKVVVQSDYSTLTK